MQEQRPISIESMKRRMFLATTASVLAAGCIETGGGSPNSSNGSPQSQNRTPGGTARNNQAEDIVEYYPEETYNTVTVGSRSDVSNPEQNRPRALGIWNARGEKQGVEVTVEKEIDDDDQTVLDSAYTIPVDDALRIELKEPATYSVEIRVQQSGATATVTVAEKDFTCNAATTQVAIKEDGSLPYSRISSTKYCGDL